MWADGTEWMDWAIRDPEYGAVIGMRDDAPDWAKEIWRRHEEARKKGLK